MKNAGKTTPLSGSLLFCFDSAKQKQLSWQVMSLGGHDTLLGSDQVTASGAYEI